MSPGKKFSSRTGSAGRGRSGGAKKPFGKGSKKFSSPRAGSKPFRKREDGDERSFSRDSKPFKRSDKRDFGSIKKDDRKFSPRSSGAFEKGGDRDKKPFGDRSKPFDKKFPARGGSKPYAKRSDRDEKPYGDRSKPFDKKFSGRGESKPYSKRGDRDEKPYGDRSKPFDKKFSGRSGSKPYAKRSDGDEKPYGDRSKPFERSEKRDFKPRGTDDPGFSERKPFAGRNERVVKPVEDRSETFHPTDDGKDFVKRDPKDTDRPKRRRTDGEDSSFKEKSKPGFGERKPFERTPDENSPDAPDRKWNRKSGHEFYGDRKKSARPSRDRDKSDSRTNDDGSIRLNKHISNAGICSRREADELIAAGVISVNGKIVTELGYKIQPGDEVKYNNETLRSERLVYILVNKPKDFITTVDDPQDRKTVMWLIRDACKERVYPVGRLDRNTTGVLLFTNDGDLAKKLTHPSFEVQKIYQVELDSSLKPSDMEQITEGVQLEDGFIKVDDIAYSSASRDQSVVGVEIHSGRNRVVRRLFEHFGYTVRKLDRVYFAGLSKKDLPRGRWRFLTPLEVSNLKMMTGDRKMRRLFEA